MVGRRRGVLLDLLEVPGLDAELLRELDAAGDVAAAADGEAGLEVVLLPEVHAVGDVVAAGRAVTALANDGDVRRDTRPDRAQTGRAAVAALGLRDLALQQARAEARVGGEARVGAAVREELFVVISVRVGLLETALAGRRAVREARFTGVVAAHRLCGGCPRVFCRGSGLPGLSEIFRACVAPASRRLGGEVASVKRSVVSKLELKC